MEFDYSMLLGKIKDHYRTQGNFAKALGIGRVSLSQRLNNHLDFSGPEMIKTCSLLDIPHERVPEYFFTEKVQKHERETTRDRPA